jgi:hypothetical protein
MFDDPGPPRQPRGDLSHDKSDIVLKKALVGGQ